MSIAGNVITCDECGHRMSMPTEPDGADESRDATVRAFAISRGWTCGYGLDLCPGPSESNVDLN